MEQGSDAGGNRHPDQREALCISQGQLFTFATSLCVPVTDHLKEAGADPPAETTRATPAVTVLELNGVNDALLSIDGAARASVLALVKSMADSAVAKRLHKRSA